MLYKGTQKICPIITLQAGGGGGSDWQPDPDWWDIKSILEADTRSYAGKAIILYSNADNSTILTISSPVVAVATSDGAFYTTTTTHTWDRSKDKIVGSDEDDTTPKYATRYLILYFDTASAEYTALSNFRLASLYAVFGCNLTKSSSSEISNNTFFRDNTSLQSFDFLPNYNVSFGTSFKNFCASCTSLVRIPDGLNTSGGKNFNSFCTYCYSLRKLPEDLDTTSGTNFGSFCNDCRALVKLPDGLNTSKGTSFGSFCYQCVALVELSDVLDVAKGTSFGDFLSGCTALVKANIQLGSTSIYSLSSSSILDVESLAYIANNAPTASASLTIGSTNISRAGGASGTIISTLTSKGWTVS